MRGLKVISLLFLCTFLYANEEVYLNTNATLYKDAKQQSALGELIVATGVKVLSEKEEVSKVEFIGYMPEGSPVIYEKAGYLINGFVTEDSSIFPVIGKKVDEYDTEWLEVSIKGYIPTSMLASDKKSVLKTAQKIYSNKCSTCHDLHHKEEFTPNVWPSILENMGAQAGLNRKDKAFIAKYLQEQ